MGRDGCLALGTLLFGLILAVAASITERWEFLRVSRVILAVAVCMAVCVCVCVVCIRQADVTPNAFIHHTMCVTTAWTSWTSVGCRTPEGTGDYRSVMVRKSVCARSLQQQIHTNAHARQCADVHTCMHTCTHPHTGKCLQCDRHSRLRVHI